LKQDSKKSLFASTKINSSRKKMYERYNIPQQKRCSSVNIFFWLLCILCILCICSAILFLSSSSTPTPTPPSLQKKEETNTKRIISVFRECLPNITHWVLVDEKSGIFYYCSESSVWEYIVQVYTSVDSMPLN
jgi:ABC-type transport system involved in multi-copper enzyme maturation permease subunit